MSANDLADRLDEHDAYDLLTPKDVDTMRAAAVLLRRQGEQLDTLRAERDRLLEAIGNPADLRRWCDRSPGVAIGVLRRIAAAVPQDPERCACGKPATGTVAGVPTCGDDR